MSAPFHQFPNEPARFSPADIERLLLWATHLGASDIKCENGQPIWITKHKISYPATRRELDDADMSALLARLYGPQATALMADKRTLDKRVEIPTGERGRTRRFRMKIRRGLSDGQEGYAIALRVLADVTPTFDEVGIEPEIRDNWFYDKGLILVTGPTGSGKSTTLAAGVNHNTTVLDIGHTIFLEQPIEFPLATLRGPHSWVSQAEIGSQIASYDIGIASAMREFPQCLGIGEMIDLATIKAALLASQTGHPVYSSGHTIGVSNTVNRNIAVFPAEQRDEVAYDLMNTLRLVVSQQMVPNATRTGVVVLREWLVFTQAIRDHLLQSVPRVKWASELHRITAEEGRSITVSAEMARAAGKIDDEYYQRVLRQ